VTDLQSTVALAADRAGAHSTAPAMLLKAQAALGRLAADADAGTEEGRRPFRPSPEWTAALADLAWLVYLLADQTGLGVAAEVRSIAARATATALDRQARLSAEASDRFL